MGKDNERPNCKSFACQADRKAKLYVYGGPYGICKIPADGIGLKYDACKRNVNRRAKAGWNTFTVVLRVIEGPGTWGYNWATLSRGGRQIQGPGPPGWGLGARLTILLCKKIIISKSKDMKAGWSNLRRKDVAQRELFIR
jgi:hypothetical protein